MFQNHKGSSRQAARVGHDGIEKTAVKSQIVESRPEEPENKRSETKVPGVVPKIIMDLLRSKSRKIVFFSIFAFE